MAHTENKCVLWIGHKHCGKTTAAAKLIDHLRKGNFTVSGILSPSVYTDGCLTGFDIVDIINGVQIPLSTRDENAQACVPFRYFDEALRLGHSALTPAANKSSNLVIVDEYGPLELNGKGWRLDVENLLKANSPPILLVVRSSLADEVRKLYGRYIHLKLDALDSKSIEQVSDFISN